VRGFHTPASPGAGRETVRTVTSDIPGVADHRLHLGDITSSRGFVTGTPSGVGVFRTPPVFLTPGDVVRVEVEGIGSVTNPVVDADGRAPDGSPAARLLAERTKGGA
jgi:hypothetical protein